MIIIQIKLERIYDKPADTDGYRILVDRLWPRGMSKVNAKLDQWSKQIGPSTELRKWFNHDPEKFSEFKKKYIDELNNGADTKDFLELVKTQLTKGDVIFLYGAKDRQNNQAVVLKDYVEKNM